MISCIFAYAKGAETQSAAVEFSDPMSALFLLKNDEHARDALRAWLVRGSADTQLGHEVVSAPPSFAMAPTSRAA